MVFPVRLPRLYAILDAQAVRASGLDLLSTAQAFRDAGISLLQYRDKTADQKTYLETARRIAATFEGSGATLIVNDWPELCVEAGWHGVHLGQGDLPVSAARAIVGPDRIIGLSTHTPGQVLAAEQSEADYVAIGPVFATHSKADPESPVGLAGVAAARSLTRKPLVAIGGISAETLSSVLAAGASSVAVIGALLGAEEGLAARARALLSVADAADPL